jgi:Ni,Fe-hydrogenase III small subunit
MANWVLKGLRTGIRTSGYPRDPDHTPGVTPGRPAGRMVSSTSDVDAIVERCPTAAIGRTDGSIAINHSRCIHCLRCIRGTDSTAAWELTYEWAGPPADGATAVWKLQNVFGRSLHIRFVDAGACGACVSEARQINNPYYNMHRLGFFITPTPRTADVLLVAGPVSDAMHLPLRKTYEAMPPPKRVVAIGVCAISGGVFGPSFASGGVADVIPVDVVVPGCPPPPLAILHALLVVVGRKPPAALLSHATDQPAGPP